MAYKQEEFISHSLGGCKFRMTGRTSFGLQTSLYILIWQKGVGALCVLSYKALIPSRRAVHSWSKHLPKAPPSTPSLWNGSSNLSLGWCGGGWVGRWDRNIQIITQDAHTISLDWGSLKQNLTRLKMNWQAIELFYSQIFYKEGPNSCYVQVLPARP